MKDCLKPGNCSNSCCQNKPKLFDILSEEELSTLFADRTAILYKAGEIISKQGTALTHLACISKGLAKSYHQRAQGGDILINILAPGKLYGCCLMGLYHDSIHHLTVQALNDVSICLIPVQPLVEVLNKNPLMANELVKMNSECLIKLYNKLANLTYKNMVGRVSDVLLFLRNDIYKDDEFELDLSRQDLADLAAITKESFIRTFKELRDTGIIEVRRNHIKIFKPSILEELSEK